LQFYRKHWPVLIIAPTSLCHQWKNEILNYIGANDYIRPEDICHLTTGRSKIHGKIVIITYSLVEKFVEARTITPEQFGVIVCDESHNLKNGDSKRCQVVGPLVKKIPIAICLSGTPAVNRPVELFTQLNALMPQTFFDYTEFIKRYCDAKPSRFGGENTLDAKGSSNEKELKMLLENMIMIRRLKKNVIEKLPEKIRDVRYVEADSKYAAEITRLQKLMSLVELKLKDGENGRNLMDIDEKKKLQHEREQLLLQFYQVTGMAKINSIQKELFQLVETARLERAIQESRLEAVNDQAKKKKNGSSNSSDDGSAGSFFQETPLYFQDEMKNEQLPVKSVKQEEETKNSQNNKNKKKKSTSQDEIVVYDLENDTQTVVAKKKELIVLDFETDIVIADNSNSNNNKQKKMGNLEEEEDLKDTDDEDEQMGESNPEKKKKTKKKMNKQKKNSRLTKNGGDDGDQERRRKRRKTDCVMERLEDESESYDNEEKEELYNTAEEEDEDELCDSEEYEEDDDDESIDEYDDDETEATDEQEWELEDEINAKNFFSKTKKGSNKNTKTAVKTTPNGKAKATKQLTVPTSNNSKGRKSSPKKTTDETKVLGKKILVFAHHKAVLSAMEEVLRTSEVQYIRVDGTTSQSKKAKLIAQFQNEDDVSLFDRFLVVFLSFYTVFNRFLSFFPLISLQVDVALLSITACGTGLNLTRANVALFAEIVWSPGAILQAEDRIHRLGQKSDHVKIIYLLARNTADDIVWDQIQKKNSVLGATIGNNNDGKNGNLAVMERDVSSSQQRRKNNNNSSEPVQKNNLYSYLPTLNQSEPNNNNNNNACSSSSANPNNNNNNNNNYYGVSSIYEVNSQSLPVPQQYQTEVRPVQSSYYSATINNNNNNNYNSYPSYPPPPPFPAQPPLSTTTASYQQQPPPLAVHNAYNNNTNNNNVYNNNHNNSHNNQASYESNNYNYNNSYNNTVSSVKEEIHSSSVNAVPPSSYPYYYPSAPARLRFLLLVRSVMLLNQSCQWMLLLTPPLH
jgi:hypothetical protein